MIRKVFFVHEDGKKEKIKGGHVSGKKALAVFVAITLF